MTVVNILHTPLKVCVTFGLVLFKSRYPEELRLSCDFINYTLCIHFTFNFNSIFLLIVLTALNKDQAFVRVLNTKSSVTSRTLLAGHGHVVDIAFASLPPPPAGRAPAEADALPDFSSYFAPLVLHTGAADKKTRTVPRLLLAATDFHGDLFLYELIEVTKPKSIQYVDL